MSLSLPRSFDTLRMSKGRARGTALAKLNPLACREHPPPAPPYRRTAGAALGRGAGVATSRGAGRLGAEASIFNVSEAAGSTLPVILSRTRAGERPGARSSRTEDVSSGYPHDGWPVVGDTDAWLQVTGQILTPAPPPSSRLRMLVLSWSKGRPWVGALGSTRNRSGRPEAARHPEADATEERPGVRISRTVDVSSGSAHDGRPVIRGMVARLRMPGQILTPARRCAPRGSG